MNLTLMKDALQFCKWLLRYCGFTDRVGMFPFTADRYVPWNCTNSLRQSVCFTKTKCSVTADKLTTSNANCLKHCDLPEMGPSLTHNTYERCTTFCKWLLRHCGFTNQISMFHVTAGRFAMWNYINSLTLNCIGGFHGTQHFVFLLCHFNATKFLAEYFCNFLNIGYASFREKKKIEIGRVVLALISIN